MGESYQYKPVYVVWHLQFKLYTACVNMEEGKSDLGVVAQLI